MLTLDLTPSDLSDYKTPALNHHSGQMNNVSKMKLKERKCPLIKMEKMI